MKQTKTTSKQKTNTIDIKIFKMYRLPEGNRIKAFVDVNFNDFLLVKGIRIVKGQKGLFVCMPQEQGANERWYEKISIKDSSIFNQLQETIINHYNQGE